MIYRAYIKKLDFTWIEKDLRVSDDLSSDDLFTAVSYVENLSYIFCVSDVCTSKSLELKQQL